MTPNLGTWGQKDADKLTGLINAHNNATRSVPLRLTYQPETYTVTVHASRTLSEEQMRAVANGDKYETWKPEVNGTNDKGDWLLTFRPIPSKTTIQPAGPNAWIARNLR